MPGFGTTNETYKNALGLMKSMGVTIKEIISRMLVFSILKISDMILINMT